MVCAKLDIPCSDHLLGPPPSPTSADINPTDESQWRDSRGLKARWDSPRTVGWGCEGASRLGRWLPPFGQKPLTAGDSPGGYSAPNARCFPAGPGAPTEDASPTGRLTAS